MEVYNNLQLRLLLLCALGISLAQAQYQTGQATYYNSIDHGYCGFGANIPSNGFVAAWPFIETGPAGQGYAQPGLDGQGCGGCVEVSCVPQWVESADGSIYLDRRDACADPERAVVVRIVDECRCSLPRDSNLPRGNFNWCCNTPTPRLGINRHIDLSQQAFSALVKDGNYGLGIIGIRWRRTSCARIGVVNIDGSSPSVPRIPATSSAAAAAPQRPSSPPRDNNYHNVEGLHTEEARENTQELPLISQCGGTGGDCSKYGSGNQCRDRPFTGYSCARGLNCERQNNWYWQCVKPDKNNIQTPADNMPLGSSTGASTSNAPGSNRPSGAPSRPAPASTSDKDLREGDQCGGKGAKCDDFSACVDGPFPGYACATGLTCSRQNEWYRQCVKAVGVTALDNTSPGSDGSDKSRDPAPTRQPASQAPKNTGSGNNEPPARDPPVTSPKTLQEVDQCGGKGARCSDYGACADKPFPGYACAKGLSCTRQNEWWWQCEKPSAKSGPTPNGSASPSNNPGTNRDTANKDSSTGASQPQQGQQAGSPSKVQGAGQQCGGLGGDCSTLGGCVRGALPGLKCAPGLTCREQNKFYWECQA